MEDTMDNNKKRLEDQDFMKMSLTDIKDEADTVIADRKKETLSMDWQSGEYTITVEIKKSISSHDSVDLEQLSEEQEKELVTNLPKEEGEDFKRLSKEEKAVVIRLAGNQKQIEVANDLKISQAKVSVIKKKNDAVLRAIIASAVPLAAILRKISNNNN